MTDYLFELPFKVRDYECDLQGIVNNAVYLNYLEHTRHEFLHHVGLDFARMHKDGVDAVVIKMEIEYKFSLRSGDEFICRLNVNREGKLKYLFLQDIYRKADNKLIVTGKVTATCVNNKTGRPIIYPEFIAAFAQTQTTSPHAVFPR